MKKRVCILILILAILGAQAGCVWNRKTVTVGGQKVVLDNSIPESTLDPADFTRKEDGSIVYNGGKYLRGIDVSAHQGKIDRPQNDLAAGDSLAWAIEDTLKVRWRRIPHLPPILPRR